MIQDVQQGQVQQEKAQKGHEQAHQRGKQKSLQWKAKVQIKKHNVKVSRTR